MGRTVALNDEAFQGNRAFDPIPVGTKVRATVFSIEEGKAQQSGRPQINVTFKVAEDVEFTFTEFDKDGDIVEERENNAKGRELRYNYIGLDNGKGAWVLASFAEALGWPIKGKQIELPDNWNTELGKELIVKIGQRANAEGRVFNTVSGYAPVKAGRPAPKENAEVDWDEL